MPYELKRYDERVATYSIFSSSSCSREKDYKTLSWWSLTGEQEEEEKIEKVDPSLEKAHEDYKSIFGKNVPANKKNDIERIQEKINETLTPVE